MMFEDVTGEADETQLKETLKRYVSRCMYIQRALYRLFSFSQHMTEPREDIIRLVISAMKAHPKQLGVQMAATACLYNLSKSELGPKIHPMCLRDIVELTLKALEQFPSHQQLQKNALLTLCSDRMLQDVSFDRYKCAKLVMGCLCAFDDPSMNRMSVAICSILAAKISTEETSVLGAKSRYMKKLLGLVKQKVNTIRFTLTVDNQLIDITLKFTLSALWNLTDESPPTCRVFLSEKGLELFMTTLQVVGNLETENRVQVETKILGLLSVIRC
ncbi:protein zyg-11 homolog B-like [Patella vulgata]|uniref:protein zyg-11 homolog B-like n=1 Tax=Patella vulgata TaxID=6465 RepID=UPI0024A88107|nr:protein zyg-11 homolog B-like [Patella vulgata]